MTDRFYLWQQALRERDQGMYSLVGLAFLFVGSYLITYVPWVPDRYGRVLRLCYEVGGGLLFIGMIIVSAL
jgi:hypothetical protein